MNTDCNSGQLEFQGFGKGHRLVVADFEGGQLSSDGGVMALAQVERKRRIIGRLAECFEDWRDPEAVEHTVREMLAQRIYGLALGYEDLNDHDELMADPLLAATVGKRDPTGQDRRREQDRGNPLAGKSTLNRLEGGIATDPVQDPYKRIGVDEEAIERLFVELFLDAHEEPPEELVIDLDATDDPLHGEQEGRFFHGYFDCYCYLPLYIFSGRHLLCARLRRSNIDASKGSVEEIDRIVGQIRERWPEVEITLRGDSGFARAALMSWCEDNGVEYVFGLARNQRLERTIEDELAEAERRCRKSGKPERLYKDFTYETLETWSRSRRVVGKAQHLPGRSNPRFVVTSLGNEEVPAAELYEDLYCARGEMENRVKEQQLDLFSTRTSAHLMKVNQLRLWLSSMAYVLMNDLRRMALEGTELARAYCDTIRLKLLKIGARIRVTCRRVWVHLSSAYPRKELLVLACQRLQRARASPA